LRKNPILKKKIYYIPSGIELGRFNPSLKPELTREQLGIPERTLVLTNVGNFSKVKGHHILLQAFKKFKEKFENSYLLLVGRDTTGEESLSLIKNMGLEKNVIPLGFRKDVPEILKLTDIFVFPSLNEGIAGSLIQAMAMKKIVVASYVGGIKSYLKHMENGIAVEPNSVDSLYEGLLTAVENLNNELMKEKARKTAEEFDINRVAKKTIELYEELLNGKGT
jgi:glycosyltransferase involved in cell wall biosynthesis